MQLQVLEGNFTVCRLPVDAEIPGWAYQSRFFNICKTDDELSIVVETSQCPNEVVAELGWRLIQVQGPLDFKLVGILASLAQPLAEAGISIFALSTYDTDYILLNADGLEKAVRVLEQAGHTFAS